MDEVPGEDQQMRLSTEMCENLANSPLRDSASPVNTCEIESPRPSSPAGLYAYF